MADFLSEVDESGSEFYELNGTFDASPVHNGTFEIAKENQEDVVNSLARTVVKPSITSCKPLGNSNLNSTRTLIRSRQKTVFLDESCTVKDEVSQLFSEFKEKGDLEKLETGILELFHKKELENELKSKEPTSNTQEIFYKAMCLSYKDILKYSLGRQIPGGYREPTQCHGNCETVHKLQRDIGSLTTDLDKLHTDNSKLYESFGKTRTILHMQKREYTRLEVVLGEEREKYKHLLEKFARVKDDCQRQLEIASGRVKDMESKHDQDTKGLRLKVKKLEFDSKTQEQKINMLTKESLELREMLTSVVLDLGEEPEDLSI